MSTIIGCALIVKDDFKNVLILQKKVKRGEEEAWCLITSKLRGKETLEKSINRGVKDSIKALAFDLEELDEVIVNEETNESLKVFVANIKEKPMLDKLYVDYRWVNKNQIDNYNLQQYEKDILKKYLA